MGWDDIANQVTTIYRDLPASERRNTVIISAYYWLPANLTATNALMVDYQPSDVAWMCTSPKLIA